MRLAWNKTVLLLTVNKTEAFEIRKLLPIPVSRYRLISGLPGRIILIPDGRGNELKEKPKSNGHDECVFQIPADSLDNGLPRFWQIDIPEDCITIREDGLGLVFNVAKALESNAQALLPKPPKVLRLAGRGEAKPTLKRATSAKSDFIPTPDWIEEHMAAAADETAAITRLDRLEQADLVILEGLLRRINGLRQRHKSNVRFAIRPGGYVGLVLASRAEIDCGPRE